MEMYSCEGCGKHYPADGETHCGCHVCWKCGEPFSHDPIFLNVWRMGDLPYCGTTCMSEDIEKARREEHV